jgi:hypothetical protein
MINKVFNLCLIVFKTLYRKLIKLFIQMMRLLNNKILIYVIVIFTIFFLGYSLYCLITKSSISKQIGTNSNNNNIAYKNITKIASIPLSGSNGNSSEKTIHELKFEEITRDYSEEIASFGVTPAEV